MKRLHNTKFRISFDVLITIKNKIMSFIITRPNCMGSVENNFNQPGYYNRTNTKRTVFGYSTTLETDKNKASEFESEDAARMELKNFRLNLEGYTIAPID